MSKKRPSGASDDAATSAEVHSAPAPAEKKPVGEWARLLLHPQARANDSRAWWRFTAADQIHRWASCEHHTGKPFECTREAFEAALKAAEGPDYTPHPGALFTLTRSPDA